jgi:hypothetical protein
MRDHFAATDDSMARITVCSRGGIRSTRSGGTRRGRGEADAAAVAPDGAR